MATKKQTAFHVVLDGIKLSRAQASAVSKAINGATLSELARLDLADGLQASIPKKEWKGIFIDRLRRGAPATVPDTSPAIPVPATASTFSVVFGDLSLSPTQAKSVEAAIRTAALGEVGRRGLSESISVRYPKEWLGIWLGHLKLNAGGPQ